MKMIWAVVRSSQVKPIAQALQDLGVGGCTAFPVRGYGEEWHLYEPLVHGGHHQIAVIVEDDLAERVIAEITGLASTGVKGDGILSVFGLDTVVHLKTKTALT